MTLTLIGSLLGKHSDRFLFQRGSGVFVISEAAHRMFARIDRVRPDAGEFEGLCAEFDLDVQAVVDSHAVIDVSVSSPLDEHIFRVTGTGTVLPSGEGVESFDGTVVDLSPSLVALWAIASRKPNLAEASLTASEIAGCRPGLISEQFASAASTMVAARVIDVGLATRPPATDERSCREH